MVIVHLAVLSQLKFESVTGDKLVSCCCLMNMAIMLDCLVVHFRTLLRWLRVLSTLFNLTGASWCAVKVVFTSSRPLSAFDIPIFFSFYELSSQCIFSLLMHSM